jgi:site-specific recombinase XerD
MVAISTGETMSFHSVRSWFNDWLTNKTGAVSERTLVRYRQVVRDFLAFMGARAEAPLASISPGDITSFRNKLREEGRSAATCNAIRGMLSVPFDVAHRLGFVPINPAAGVEVLGQEREAAASPSRPRNP